jgi:hypothetical protein
MESPARLDRLCIVRLGSQSIAVPHTDIERFVAASQLRFVSGGAAWLKGLVAQPGSADPMPVIDLAALWHDEQLTGSWKQLLCTHAGVAFGIDGYTITGVLEIRALRPAPGTRALGRAVVFDGRPVPVLNCYELVSVDQWQALKVPA